MQDLAIRSWRWCILFALLCVSTACFHVNTRPKGFQEVRSTRAELEESFAPQRWALVIGVPRYQDPTWSRLNYTISDAQELARVLRETRYGGFQRVILLTTPEQTTRTHILAELRRLRNDLRKQDTLVFYFSGHGSLELNGDGMAQFYLAASDTRTHDLLSTGIELATLRTFLEELKPQRSVMILDNCFAGTGKSRVTASTLTRLQQVKELFRSFHQLLGRSEAMLMASALGGLAQEDDRLGHGTYTHFLLQALTSSSSAADVNQDGAVTVYEAHDFARNRTVTHTQGTQIPEGHFRVLGQAEIYLSGTPGPELAKASALIYAYGLGPEGAVSISVDGNLKGTFPRTVPIAPGLRQLKIQDVSGKTLAQGELMLKRGHIYPMHEVIDALQGVRRYAGFELGMQAQAGPLQQLWGSSAMRIGVLSGHRIRTGSLQGLTLGLSLGYTDVRLGEWKTYTTQQQRPVFDTSLRLILRKKLHPVQLGGGWHVQAELTPSVMEGLTEGTIRDPTQQLLDRWLTLQTGPIFWQGISLHHNLMLRIEERILWSHGSLNGSPAASSFQLSTGMGLELGF